MSVIMADDSMENIGIRRGDELLINPLEKIADENVAYISVDGKSPIVRRVRVNDDNSIILEAANPKYKPLIFTAAEAEQRLMFIGKVYERRRTFPERKEPCEFKAMLLCSTSGEKVRCYLLGQSTDIEATLQQMCAAINEPSEFMCVVVDDTLSEYCSIIEQAIQRKLKWQK